MVRFLPRTLCETTETMPQLTRHGKGRLSLKRKVGNSTLSTNPDETLDNSAQFHQSFLLSENEDTLVGCLHQFEAVEREAASEVVAMAEQACALPTQALLTSDEDAGRKPSSFCLSPIPIVSRSEPLSSPSSPILSTSARHPLSHSSTNKRRSLGQISESRSESYVPNQENELPFASKNNSRLSDNLVNSGCEGTSIVEDAPWAHSIWVPERTPDTNTSACKLPNPVSPGTKTCNLGPTLSTPKCASSSSDRSTVVRDIREDIRPLEEKRRRGSTSPLSDTRSNISMQGIYEINWDESMKPKDKSDVQNDFQKSLSYSEKWHQQLVLNFNRSMGTPIQSPFPKALSEEELFYGLPRKVQELFQNLRGIKELYDWQKECLSMPEVRQRKNLVYALPTSGGKTLVAEILLLKEILINRKNTLFILPYVSIVQEKVRALSQLAVELDFFVEEYAGGKGAYPPKKRRCKNAVYVATIEKALGLVHSLIKEERLHEIGLVIVDELHLLGEGSRGATLEAVLTNLRFKQAEIQIVGMSATIGNLEEIANFLDAKTFAGDFRPVELKEYIKCGETIYSYNRKMIDECESPVAVERVLSSSYTEDQLKNDPDQIGTLVGEVIPGDSCLVFCATRKNCENVALLICKAVPVNLKTYRVEEKKALFKALAAEGNGNICSILKRTIPYGIAYHHSGLTTAERRLLEEAFLAQTLCVICCTSTLAAGVNLPARRVILRSPFVGIEFIDLSRYKQMVGRAGRAGFGGVGESILVCLLKDYGKVLDLLKSDMTESFSHLDAEEGAGMKALVLHSVSLGLASCRAEIHSVAQHTLLRVQAKRKGIDVIQLADNCIKTLVSEGGFCISEKICDKDQDNDANTITVSLPNSCQVSDEEKIISIGLNTPLSLSRIGEAAVKGSFTLDIAYRLQKDLQTAQAKLVLLNHLHLLYVVTPYSMIDMIKYDNQVYFSLYMELSSEELQVANTLGITEAVMVSVMKRNIIKTVPQTLVSRFYLTLMLYDLWHQKSIWQVSNKFQVSRGIVFSLLQAASAFASSVLRFCEALEEFWCFKVLLNEMCLRLSHCCSVELIPLMELPAVKIGRARQLYNAGFRTLRDVASADPVRIIKELDHMPRKTAYQIVAAAKLLLIQKAESLRDEASEFLEGLNYQNKEAMPPQWT